MRAGGSVHVTGVAMGERLVVCNPGEPPEVFARRLPAGRTGLFRNARTGETRPASNNCSGAAFRICSRNEPTIIKTKEINR